MAIKDLQPRAGNVNLVLELIEIGRAREFDKFGKKGKVCNAKAKDETGVIVLTLWNDDCDKFSVGDKVQITNGYVSEYQGEMQLGTGKFGKLELVDGAVSQVKEEEKKLSEVKAKRVEEEEEELDEIGSEIEDLDKEVKHFEKDDEVYFEDEFVEEEVVEDKHKKK